MSQVASKEGPKMVKKRPLTTSEMRYKASFRAMEKLLEDQISNENQLWSVARVMSDEEFLATAEERTLAKKCGNPLCSKPLYDSSPNSNKKYRIDAKEQKVYSAIHGPEYCCVTCSDTVASFLVKLGSTSQAVVRFGHLLDHIRQKREQISGSSSIHTQSQQHSATHASSESVPLHQKNPPASSSLAAGTSKNPIMMAEIKERDSTATHTKIKPSLRPTSTDEYRNFHRAQTIEGYIPRTTSVQKQNRVRFRDDVRDQSIVSEEVQFSKASSSSPSPSPSGNTAIENISPSLPLSPAPAVQPPQQGAGPVFVFDVEDAKSPIDGNGHQLDAPFGRLHIIDDPDAIMDMAGNDGITRSLEEEEEETREEIQSDKKESMEERPNEEEFDRINKIVRQHLRQGVNTLFPRLASTLPEDIQRQLDSADEEGLSTDRDGSLSDVETEDWMLSDNDTNASLDYDNDDNDVTSSANGVLRYRPKLSFFGEMHQHIECWITELTHEFLASGSKEFGERDLVPAQTASSVPEIKKALTKFIAVALPPVVEKMSITAPRNEIEKELEQLLRTFYLVNALPGFTSTQWQVVVLVLLKALSMDRMPILRPFFETRDGIHRLNKTLGGYSFTIEEFYSILELLLEPEY